MHELLHLRQEGFIGSREHWCAVKGNAGKLYSGLACLCRVSAHLRPRQAWQMTGTIDQLGRAIPAMTQISTSWWSVMQASSNLMLLLHVQALARLHPAGLADDWADKLAGQGFFSRAQKATFEHYMQVCIACTLCLTTHVCQSALHCGCGAAALGKGRPSGEGTNAFRGCMALSQDAYLRARDARGVHGRCGADDAGMASGHVHCLAGGADDHRPLKKKTRPQL